MNILPKDRNPLGCVSRKIELDENGKPKFSVHKTYDLKRLKSQHREIARRLIVGETATQISKSLGLTTVAIRLIISSPLFQSLLAELNKEADLAALDFSKRISFLKEDSLDVVQETLNSSDVDQALKVKTAFSILDRDTEGHVVNRGSNMTVNINEKTFIKYSLVPREKEEVLPPEDLKEVVPSEESNFKGVKNETAT